MASRDLDDLLPGTQKKVEAWLAACVGIISQAVFVLCTYRSQMEQDALYAQDREPLEEVNRLRKLADMPPITEKENESEVTWTRHSKHTERRAVDFSLKMPNPWDLKADIDNDHIPDYTEVGQLAEKFGLQWGVINKKGKHVDLGHVQDNEIYTA